MWLGSPVWFLPKLGRRGIKLRRKQGPTAGGVRNSPSPSSSSNSRASELGASGFPFGFLGAGGRLPKARRGRVFIAQFIIIRLVLLVSGLRTRRSRRGGAARPPTRLQRDATARPMAPAPQLRVEVRTRHTDARGGDRASRDAAEEPRSPSHPGTTRALAPGRGRGRARALGDATVAGRAVEKGPDEDGDGDGDGGGCCGRCCCCERCG